MNFRVLVGFAIAAAGFTAGDCASARAAPSTRRFDFPIVSEQSSEAHQALIYEARFLDHERTLLTIDHQRDVKLWDVATGALKATHPFGPSLIVSAVSLTSDEKWMVILAGRLMLMNLETGQIVWRVENDIGFTHAALHPDGKSILVTDARGPAVYDRASGKRVRTFGPNPGDQQVLRIAFLSPERVLTIALHGEITTWNWATGQVEKVRPALGSDYVVEWSLIPGREPMIVASPTRGPSLVVNLATWDVRTFDSEPWTGLRGWAVAGPQRKLLTAHAVFDLPAGGLLGRMETSDYDKVCISPSGQYLFATSLRIWRLYRLPKSF